MLDKHRDKFLGLEKIIGKIFGNLPLTPNQYTSLSIILALVCAYLIVAADYWLALAFFLLAVGLDFIDGAVARARNLATKRGAYWDTIADRYVEAIILFGLLFAPLPQFFLPAYVWAFLVLFGSTMTTYVKAAAFEKGLVDTEIKGGLLSRAERIMFYAAILILLPINTTWALYLLIFLAVFSNITAVQRIIFALKK